MATEVALSLVMLVGSSLLGRSLVHLSSVDTGFTPNGLLFVQVSASTRVWADSASAEAFVDATVRELRALPGVAAVSGSNAGLFNGNSSSSPLKVVGRVDANDATAHDAQQRVVLADYFRTMRVPITTGRDFSSADNASSEPVAIISRAEARRDFPDESPIGKRVIWQAKEWTVIGVAADVHYTGLATDFQPTIYIPAAQRGGDWMSFVVRATGDGDGAALIRIIRERISAVKAGARVTAVDPVPTLVAAIPTLKSGYRTLLGSLFGIIGCVLAAIGMFGVISRTVARRLREAGIRAALGAPARSLTRLMSFARR